MKLLSSPLCDSIRYQTIVGLFSLACSSSLLGQQYSINWFTLDGGGGTSTGGVYSVSGTVGQPDAGKLSGGNYSVDGGFWGIIAAVQTPGAPLLRVARTQPSAVLIAWPDPSTGFVLQQNANLAATNWVAVTNAPVVVNGEKQVIVTPMVGNRYYRLKYQP
jgi:hypothetical protein